MLPVAGVPPCPLLFYFAELCTIDTHKGFVLARRCRGWRGSAPHLPGGWSGWVVPVDSFRSCMTHPRKGRGRVRFRGWVDGVTMRQLGWKTFSRVFGRLWVGLGWVSGSTRGGGYMGGFSKTWVWVWVQGSSAPPSGSQSDHVTPQNILVQTPLPKEKEPLTNSNEIWHRLLKF